MKPKIKKLINSKISLNSKYLSTCHILHKNRLLLAFIRDILLGCRLQPTDWLHLLLRKLTMARVKLR